MRKHEAENELLLKIKDRIKWDKRISLEDLKVDVQGGVVTVSGYVDSAFKHHAALEAISETEGVWSIEDRIIVPQDYYRGDGELRDIIRKQLNDMIKLGDEHIEVDVYDGVVKLEGEVFRPRLKAMADSAVWELSGVRDCLNFIEIKSPPYRVPHYSSEQEVLDDVN